MAPSIGMPGRWERVSSRGRGSSQTFRCPSAAGRRERLASFLFVDKARLKKISQPQKSDF